MSQNNFRAKNPFFDVLAMGLSGLCLIHCLFMPFFIAFLPFLALFDDNPLVHKVLVLVAAPISFLALILSSGVKRLFLVSLALIGVGLLAVGAFYAPFEPFETPLTVAGASLLALIHLINALNSPHHKKQA